MPGRDAETMKDPQEYNVRAVERALAILRCFDDEHPERGLSEVAQAVNLHKATAHRIVTTLLNHGYLERTADGERYRLGLQLADLGFKVVRRMDLRREALPYMRELAQQFDETCDLSILDQGSVFDIEVVRRNHALTIAAAVGQRMPAYCTASGRVFLAHLPAAELDAMLNRPLLRCTEKTNTSPVELRRELEVIRRQGYAVDDEEYEDGIRAVAAPIRDRGGQVVAVLAMPGPANRLTPERVPEIATALQEAAEAISHRMGWQS